VRLNDGGEAWRYPAKADNQHKFFAEPLLADDLLAIGDYSNVFYALNVSTGTENWRVEGTRGNYVAGAATTDGYIYAPSSDHTLYAFDMDGQEQWSFKTSEPLWGKVAVNGSKVYLPAMNHTLYALDSATGKEVWSTVLGGALVSGPTLGDDGTLYISSLGKAVHALEVDSGDILWRFDTNDGIWASPTLYEGVIYFGDASGMIYAVDAASGKQQWQLEASGIIIGSGAAYNDGLFFGTEEGELIAVSFDGKKQWTRSVTGKLYSTPVVTEDRIVASVTDGEFLLIAWDLQGNEVWTFQPVK
jgi:outer membrane protein assembly factor BamB